MFILLFLLSFTPAYADVMNLNENMPTRLVDASVTKLHKIDLQGSVNYDDEDARLTLDPYLRWGVVKRIQVEYVSEFEKSLNNKKNDHDSHKLGFQWNFNDQDDWVPSMAISPQAIYPVGGGSEVVDYAVKYLLTYTLVGTLVDPVGQFHLNYRWSHNSDQRDEPRKIGKQTIFGYAHKIGKYSSLVVDFINEVEFDEAQIKNDVELGWLFEFKKDMYLGSAVAIDTQLEHFGANLSGQLTF